MIIYGFSALTNYTYTIYAPFILKEMGWTASDFGGVYSTFLLVMLIGGLLAGWLTDRFGPRRVIMVGAGITAIGMVLFSTMKTISQAYIYYPGIIAVGLSLQFIIPTQTLARRWFFKRAAFATGLIMSVFGIIAAVFFPLLAKLASQFGWRNMILFSGIIIEVVVFLLAVLVVRDSPESMGLNMDGMSDEEARIVFSGGMENEPHMTRGEALKTPQFWIMTMGIALIGMIFTGFMGHITMIGLSVGMTGAQAATVMSAYALPSIIGRFTGGWFADKLGKRKVFIIFTIISGLIYVYAWQMARSAGHLYAFAALFGIFSSPILVTVPPFFGDLFGRIHLASILGLQGIIQGGITAMGPVLAGKMAEATGGYNTYYLLGAIASLIFVLAVPFIRPTRVENELVKLGSVQK